MCVPGRIGKGEHVLTDPTPAVEIEATVPLHTLQQAEPIQRMGLLVAVDDKLSIVASRIMQRAELQAKGGAGVRLSN